LAPRLNFQYLHTLLFFSAPSSDLSRHFNDSVCG
jgi:hypothetical protein